MITSNHNPKIQQVKSLLNRPKDRHTAGQFVAEGVRLVEEAWKAGLIPDQVFYSQSVSDRGQQMVEDYRQKDVEIEEVLPSLIDSLAPTENSQGLLAVFPLQSLPLPAHLDFTLILDNLRDPGNLGAILRTSAAAGVNAVFLTPGTTDPYAPKVLRAGMGAHFRLPVLSLPWDEIIQIHKQPKTPLHLFLADVDAAAVNCWKADLRQPLALVIGGEAEGATESGRRAADELIAIPMPGSAESLNAAIAASILIFEVTRQRFQ